MHPDLSPHLHSEECNAAIRILLACHGNVSFDERWISQDISEFSSISQNKVGKFFGVCNEVNEELNRCLKREREDNRAKNKAKGLAMREKVFLNQEKNSQ